MLYIGIPIYNEAPTIGVLLWQIRKVFQDFERDYEIVVYDDASTDATAEILRPYANVLPLTILTSKARDGYARALDGICRAVAQRARHPRRDALITMQGDFTDVPAQLPELVTRFEGGADIVVVERSADQRGMLPGPVRRLRRLAAWVIRPFVHLPGVSDPFGSFRLYRVSVLRDALKGRDAPATLIAHGGWSANVELLLHTAPFARRIDTVMLPERYDLRPRATRVRPFADIVTLYRFGRVARARRAPAGAGRPS